MGIRLEKQKGDDLMKVHTVHPQYFLLLSNISDFDILVVKQEGGYSSVSFPITIGHTIQLMHGSTMFSLGFLYFRYQYL